MIHGYEMQNTNQILGGLAFGLGVVIVVFALWPFMWRLLLATIGFWLLNYGVALLLGLPVQGMFRFYRQVRSR